MYFQLYRPIYETAMEKESGGGSRNQGGGGGDEGTFVGCLLVLRHEKKVEGEGVGVRDGESE